MKRKTCCFAPAAVLCLILAVPAFAADQILMKIQGGIQGIPVLQCSETPQSPRQGAGTPHELNITKEVGTASAQLQTALVTKEMLKEVVFEFFRPNPKGDGSYQLIYTIKLTNAKIAGIRQIAGAVTGATHERSKKLEEISFTCQKMELSTASGPKTGGWGK
jgi:type VI secretion system Hcp family effector